MDRVKHENFCRAVVEDNTALLLSAVARFRKEALCRIRKGSDASRVLDQEMSTRLLHLACKHDAVECARLLLEGGSGITAAPVDARDQLTRTLLLLLLRHLAAAAPRPLRRDRLRMRLIASLGPVYVLACVDCFAAAA
jgi:hypothetical protein